MAEMPKSLSAISGNDGLMIIRHSLQDNLFYSTVMMQQHQ